MIPLALACFRRRDWPRWCEIDPAGFSPDSFRRWERKRDKALAELGLKGIEVVQVIIDPEKFLAWCEGTGAPLGNMLEHMRARAAYAGISANTGGHPEGEKVNWRRLGPVS